MGLGTLALGDQKCVRVVSLAVVDVCAGDWRFARSAVG